MWFHYLIVILLGFALLSGAASAGEIDLSDDINAKLALVKAKARHLDAMENEQDEDDEDGDADDEDEDDDDGGGDDGDVELECGAMSIGTTVVGSRGRVPREITVVVTGDVINANNRCR